MTMKWNSSTTLARAERGTLNGLTFRHASLEDAPLLSELGARTFRDAFAHRMNPVDVAAYLAKSFSLAQVQEELGDPLATYILTLTGGEPAGYAKLYQGPSPECVLDRPAIELVRFYTCQPWWGRGVSGAQMQVCLDLACQAGFSGIWLSSWKLNDRANAFYRKWGFTVAGEKTFTVGSDVQEDFIYARQLEGKR